MKQHPPPRPAPPANLADDAAVTEYKAALRAWDRKVLKDKILSRHELNTLNTAFPRKTRTKFKIVNFEEALQNQR